MMAYDDSSFYGDMIVEEYDESNNFMNPISPTGYYIYKMMGYCFDRMQDLISKFMNDFSILSADASSLDYFWGVSYNMPRPKIGEEGNERLLTDEEYRNYLYLRNCQLITEQDIIMAMTKCFSTENDKQPYMGELKDYLEVTDHLSYTAIEKDGSNIHKRDNDNTKHFITDYSHNSDTEKIQGRFSKGETVQVVYIPFNNWDKTYLEFLEQYISIKGTLKIREYY